jgi:ParB family chromosome partitioning protein
LEREGNRARALEIVKAPTFGAWDTDKRFEALADGLREKSSRARAETWSAKDGTHAAKVSRAGKKLTLTFDDRVAPRFGDFVRDRLQTLYEEFKAGDPPA